MPPIYGWAASFTLPSRFILLIIYLTRTSGFPYPSERDREATRNLYRDGRQWGIEVLDSVIIALGGYYSFREEGVLRAWREEK